MSRATIVVTYTPPRRIFAAVALDGSGVWAIGDSAEEARAGALDHRDYDRDCARSDYDDFPPPETDAAWLDTLALVTLSGTTESLRAIVKALDLYFPDASADTAWLDTLTLVTLSGTTEGLRALIRSMETGDSVAPWCPADLWDSPSPTKEP